MVDIVEHRWKKTWRHIFIDSLLQHVAKFVLCVHVRVGGVVNENVRL